MSGTSLDRVDAVLADFSNPLSVRASAIVRFRPSFGLRSSLQTPGPDEIETRCCTAANAGRLLRRRR
jgi:1,6-anhydro-N-acetylmuramate kinase